jgi:hypothetical protein
MFTLSLGGVFPFLPNTVLGIIVGKPANTPIAAVLLINDRLEIPIFIPPKNYD